MTTPDSDENTSEQILFLFWIKNVVNRFSRFDTKKGSEATGSTAAIMFVVLCGFGLGASLGIRYIWNLSDFIALIAGIFVAFYVLFLLISASCYRLRLCCTSGGDDNVLESLVVCIPSYKEDRRAMERTINSVINADWPKDKLKMFIIVDGHQDGYKDILEILGVLEIEECDNTTRRITCGVHPNGLAWTVLVKENNQGKRHSQWIFTEALRMMKTIYQKVTPEYVLFLDSDTEFEPGALKRLYATLSQNKQAAGVCGMLEIESEYLVQKSCKFNLLSMLVVGYQSYEYYFNQCIRKQAESCFSSVGCLPGAFTMFKLSALLQDIDPAKQKDAEHKIVMEEETSLKFQDDTSTVIQKKLECVDMCSLVQELNTLQPQQIGFLGKQIDATFK